MIKILELGSSEVFDFPFDRSKYHITKTTRREQINADHYSEILKYDAGVSFRFSEAYQRILSNLDYDVILFSIGHLTKRTKFHHHSPHDIAEELTVNLTSHMTATADIIGKYVHTIPQKPILFLYLGTDSIYQTYPLHIPYSVAKAGLNSFVKNLKIEYEKSDLQFELLNFEQVSTSLSSFRGPDPVIIYSRIMELIDEFTKERK